MWDSGKVFLLRKHRRTSIKIAEGMQKGKVYVGIHDTAHAPDERSHREKIFYYEVRSVINTSKLKNK